MKVVKHPMSSRGFIIRYQWISEMCQNRRTEADIVGILIGFTEKAAAENEKSKRNSDDWEWVSVSLQMLATMTSESVRTVQRALRWLEQHNAIETFSGTRGNGSTQRSSYKLNLELLDKVADARDRERSAVQLALVSGVVVVIPATGVTKRHPPVTK